MSGFFAADSDRWPTVARMLIATGVEWEPDAIVLDLQWWADRVARWHATDGRDGEPRIPDRRAMRKRWACSDWTARKALRAEGPWRRWVDGDDAVDASPAPLPRPSRSSPGPLPRRHGETPKIGEDSPAPLPVPSRSSPGPLHTRGNQAPVHPAPSTQETEPPDPPPSGGRGARGPTEADVQVHALRVIEEVRQRPVGMGDTVTDRKTLTAFWRHLGKPDPETWGDDVALVARAFRECPAPIFARDVRAEGWESGTDRHRDVGTLCVQRRWSARLEAARQWRDEDFPTAPLTPAIQPRGRDRPGAPRSFLDRLADLPSDTDPADDDRRRDQADLRDPRGRWTHPAS